MIRTITRQNNRRSLFCIGRNITIGGSSNNFDHIVARRIRNQAASIARRILHHHLRIAADGHFRMATVIVANTHQCGRSALTLQRTARNIEGLRTKIAGIEAGRVRRNYLTASHSNLRVSDSCHNNTCAGVSRTHFDLAALDLEFRVHQHNAKLAQVKLSASPAVLNGKRSPILDFKSVLSANSRHGHGFAVQINSHILRDLSVGIYRSIRLQHDGLARLCRRDSLCQGRIPVLADFCDIRSSSLTVRPRGGGDADGHDQRQDSRQQLFHKYPPLIFGIFWIFRYILI